MTIKLASFFSPFCVFDLCPFIQTLYALHYIKMHAYDERQENVYVWYFIHDIPEGMGLVERFPFSRSVSLLKPPPLKNPAYATAVRHTSA